MLLNFINEILIIFIISFLLNGSILYFVKSGLFGNDLKIQLNIVLENKIHLVTIISFFLFLLVSLYLNIMKIYLDNTEVIVKTVINNSEIVITGSLLMSLFQNLGSAGVFAASTRIAAGLLANKPMAILPKLGLITGTGLGSTISFRLVCNNIPIQPSGDAKIKTGPIEVILENSSNNLSSLSNNLIEHCKKFSINNSQLNVSNEILNNGKNKVIINGNMEASSKIINELEKLDPNWKDSFSINSPLENGDTINKFIIDTLSDNFLLHVIMLYMLAVLIFIIFCKFYLQKQPQFPKIQNLPFGNLIHKFLTYIISVWQMSNNIWIYFIIFFLFVFNLASTISIYKLLIYFQSL